MRTVLLRGATFATLVVLGLFAGCEMPTEEDSERQTEALPFPPCGGVENIRSASVAYNSNGTSLTANLRARPSTLATVLDLLESGTVLKVLAAETTTTTPKNWLKVQTGYGSTLQTGYLADWLVKTTCASEPAPPTTTKKKVYLTFDDGPTSLYTPQVLDLLKEFSAKGTFFLLGNQVKLLPPPPAGTTPNPTAGDTRVRRILAEGHAIGNHSWDHPSVQGMSETNFNKQLLDTQARLRPYGAFAPGASHCFRPPYGNMDSTTRSKASAIGYKVFTWNVDPQDWARPGASTISSRILTNVYDGAIVLMHDGGGDRSQTVTALRTVLTSLKDTFQFLSMPDCR